MTPMLVQLFYLVSGFYMGLVLRTKYRPGDYGRFLVRRMIRRFWRSSSVSLRSL